MSDRILDLEDKIRDLAEEFDEFSFTIVVIANGSAGVFGNMCVVCAKEMLLEMIESKKLMHDHKITGETKH